MKGDEPRLKLSGLEVWRGKVKILRDLHWTVQRGEHWVMLGPNGSGKTSLLAALTGYLTPSAGTVRVLGQTYGCCDWRELRKRVGLVSSALRQQITDEAEVLELVAAGRDAIVNPWKKPSPQDRRRAKQLLRRFGVEKLIGRDWGVLSQGERQKILIARALMARPEILILDEPCAGLDPGAREDFLDRVEQLAHQPDGPTLVLVTHHVEEITPAFTHAILLQAGGVVAAGPVNTTLTTGHLQGLFGVGFRLMRRKMKNGFRFELKRNPNALELEA
jgi:iron complex transport system ATP-binding protein